MVAIFLSLIRDFKLDRPGAPLIVQCFETEPLKAIAKQLKMKSENKSAPVRLTQLLDSPTHQPADFVVQGDKRTFRELMSPTGLKEISAYAQAIGPSKSSPFMASLIRDSHRVGLEVHAYTFKKEDIPNRFKGDLSAEIRSAFQAGVDAVFSDFPIEAVRAKSKKQTGQ
jgi:glycerophosphoryl diester phosphodiesterase